YSGWAFRSSWEAAARVYARAGDVAPSAADQEFRGWLFDRQSRVLTRNWTRLRTGYALKPDSTDMWGYGYLSGDTVAYAPRNRVSFVTPAGDAPVELRDALVARNLEVLRTLVEQWVLRTPQSASAYAALTNLAEATGG